MNTVLSITAAEICDQLGRAAIARRVGVGTTAVSNAAVDGRFPARWFDVLESMCRDASLPCPRSLFTFVQTDRGRE